MVFFAYFFKIEFYYLCYEGAINLDSIKDWNKRHALEVQIMEFGQIPKQVFKNAHPARTCAVTELGGNLPDHCTAKIGKCETIITN